MQHDSGFNKIVSFYCILLTYIRIKDKKIETFTKVFQKNVLNNWINLWIKI